MRTNTRFALIAALLLGAAMPALAQTPPSSAQQKADNDRIIDNQRDISQMQNQLETQHLESQQRFQQQPGQVTPQFPPTPPGFIPMPENNPPPVPKL